MLRRVRELSLSSPDAFTIIGVLAFPPWFLLAGRLRNPQVMLPQCPVRHRGSMQGMTFRRHVVERNFSTVAEDLPTNEDSIDVPAVVGFIRLGLIAMVGVLFRKRCSLCVNPAHPSAFRPLITLRSTATRARASRMWIRSPSVEVTKPRIQRSMRTTAMT